jgi:succinyl-CoA synthetase alpha subunit
MSVLLNSATRAIAVAATGAYGGNQILTMRAAGTSIVGIVALGRAGQIMNGLPIFDTVADAVASTSADAAIIYAPPLGVRSALLECADAGLRLAVAAAEFVPIHDALYAAAYAHERGTRVVGPNTVGMASPGQAMLGAVTPFFTLRGRIGIISRSGTLTLVIARMLTRAGHGQSTIVHVGGDVIVGTNPDEWLTLFDQDAETTAVVYIGEIGGTKEYALAERIKESSKPVASFVVGRYAPAEKQMGHAGALVGSDRETAAAKQAVLAEAGATVCDTPEALLEFAAAHA